MHYTRFAFLLYVLAPLIHAQYEQAAITGTVKDPQGGGVPGARIQVRNNRPALIRSTLSSNAGVFFLAALPLGSYDLSASQPGFAEVRITSVRLAIGETKTLDLNLKIGQNTEQISVTARSSELDQASSAIGASL